MPFLVNQSKPHLRNKLNSITETRRVAADTEVVTLSEACPDVS